MATAIKAIPTLKGKEAREFLLRADEVERKFVEAERNGNDTYNRDENDCCVMAHTILSKAGML